MKKGVQSAASLAPGATIPIPDDTAFAAAYDAEFEAVWLQVRFHEGAATVADVEEAIERVNELRRLARDLVRRRRTSVVFASHEARPSALAGN